MEFSKNPLVILIQKGYEYVLQYKKEFSIAAVSVFLLGLLIIGYFFYRSNLQQRAHASFVESLKLFEGKILSNGAKDETIDIYSEVFSSGKEKWTKVAESFRVGFEKFKGSDIESIFLAYQAEALINLGEFAHAIDVLNEALKIMPKASIYSYYQVKLALMEIDYGNEKDGLESLKKISLDQKNPVNDMVLYRLGEYFWFKKNFEEAKNYWNQLILKYGKTTQKISWWAQLARPKLKLISI